jgi:prephenate dehydrogenase
VFWNQVSLLGVGLLGGSLGLALKRHGLARRVTGLVRRRESIPECERAGAVDVATLDARAAVEQAELLVLCTPVGQMRGVAEQALQFLKPGAVVTDVGSVKGQVLREIERAVAKAGGHFIGSHPMAGAEKMGVMAARPDLFERAVCVVTSTPDSHRRSLRAVERLWQGVGGRVLRMTAREHDCLVSRSSHLPHVLAVALVNFVLGTHAGPEQALLCANGFRDTTRIASGSPEMWRDIALANRKHLKRALMEYMRELSRVRKAIANGDEVQLRRFFERGKELRDKWAVGAATPSPE